MDAAAEGKGIFVHFIECKKITPCAALPRNACGARNTFEISLKRHEKRKYMYFDLLFWCVKKKIETLGVGGFAPSPRGKISAGAHDSDHGFHCNIFLHV